MRCCSWPRMSRDASPDWSSISRPAIASPEHARMSLLAARHARANRRPVSRLWYGTGSGDPATESSVAPGAVVNGIGSDEGSTYPRS